MEPIIPSPAKLAAGRFTSKTNKQRNLDLVAGLKAGNANMSAAIDYLKKGFSLSDSTGILLDAWGEQSDNPRNGRDDTEYRQSLLEDVGDQTLSLQSRPAMGSYIQQVYKLKWLALDKVGLTAGAVGAAFNRVPLRMVFVQCGGMAPDIELPENMASATLGVDVYSAATAPNIQLTQGAPMFPGNAFPCVWGGIEYERTQVTVRATETQGLRVRALQTLLTRLDGTATVNGDELVQPFNTLVTVKQLEVKNG